MMSGTSPSQRPEARLSMGRRGLQYVTPSIFVCILASVLILACSESGFTAPDAAVAVERASPSGDGADARVIPPVTDQHAFTWTTDDPNVPWGACPEWMPEGCELAVIQGDPEQPNADVFFKLKPGTTVPEHYHTSVERMVLLSGELEVNYEGQDPVTMTPGIYAYGPAKLPHETHCLEGNDDCILFIVFEDPVDAIPGKPDEIPEQEAFTWIADGSNDVVWGDCPEWFPEGCGLAVLQALDADGYNADALLRLSPNTTIPMHWHTSAERMVLVAGEFRVNYQGQPPVTLEPFTYAYGPAELPHDARCGDQGDCILFIAFEEPIDAVDIRGGDLPHRR